MARRKYTGMELGMLLGIAIGGGLGTILFATTGNPLFVGLTGVGLVIGVVIGAGIDKRRSRSND